jgi:hypothetical protein
MRVLVCLIAITVGCYRGSAPPPAPPAPAPKAPRSVSSSDALAYLPEDSSLIVVADLAELMGSQSMKTLAPVLQKRIPANVAQYFATCGFDPLTLKRASMGLRNTDATKPSGVMVLRGYRRDVLMKCIEQAHAAQPSALTIDRGVVTMAATDSKLALAFADDHTLVIQIGPETTAETLRNVLDTGAPLRLNARFTELIAKLDPSHPLWFVFDDAKVMAGAPLGSPVRTVMGSARIADSLTTDVRIRFADPAGAVSAATLLQTQTASAMSFFDELTINPDDLDVVVHATMSDAKFASALSVLTGTLGP